MDFEMEVEMVCGECGVYANEGANSSSSWEPMRRGEGEVGEEAAEAEARATNEEQGEEPAMRRSEGEVMEEAAEAEARATNEEQGEEPAADTRPRMRQHLHEPSNETRRKHEAAGHIPYRPWCRACCLGRMPDIPHTGLGPLRTRSTIPEVHGDYCFFRDHPGAPSIPTIVIKDRDSLAVAAHALPFRGGMCEWAVRQVVRDLKKWGVRGDCTVRCDQEDALIDFFNQVARLRTPGETNSRTFLEHNPVADSKKNGFIEVGIKSLEGATRSIKCGLEEKIQQKVPAESAVFSWLVEHAADMLCKHQTGVDGKTPYERLKGKPWRGEAVEFGSGVLHLVPGRTTGG